MLDEDADVHPQDERTVPEVWGEGATEWDGTSPRCFIDPVFAKKKIQKLKDIEYGSNFNPKTKKEEKLLLDAYFPDDSDTRELRPAVVWMHGGAFNKGNKASGNKLAEELVRRGYVVFSISYRLAGDVKPEEQLERFVA